MSDDFGIYSSLESADFQRSFLDPSEPIHCIGEGSIGGKAQGLASILGVLQSRFRPENFGGIRVGIPWLAVLRTGVFDAFMEGNGLYRVVEQDLPDEEILHAFQKADLPFEVLGDLRALIEKTHNPLAIRSSSLLEDAKHEPFAGIYETKMIPNNQFDPDERFRRLAEAIKFIYGSTFAKRARDYRLVNHHGERDEKMAVIIQEVVGKRYHQRFYPELSGVARSYNYYPVKPALPEEGVVSLALGLGKTIVDGGLAWTFSPAHPEVQPPFRCAEEVIQWTQTEFWMVNMGEPSEYDPIHETEYLLKGNLSSAERDGTLTYLVSTYDAESDRLSMGMGAPGPRALTFAPLVAMDSIPLNRLLVSLLKTCEEAAQSPVEIEFAMTFDPHRFDLLQVRSMVVPTENIHVDESELRGEGVLLASTNVLGNGVVDDIRDIIFTRPDIFTLADTKKVVPELAQFNHQMISQGRPYLLIVLGRLGTTDHWLGIPADWGQVSGARVIVEATQENVVVDLSQGTHYFHNIIGQGVKYFTLAYSSPYKVDWDWLNRQDVAGETQFLRHVRLPAPLNIRVDGRSNQGVICKP